VSFKSHIYTVHSLGLMASTRVVDSWVVSGSNAYYLHSASIDFTTATAYCSNINATVASIHSSTENSLVYNLWPDIAKARWLGASRVRSITPVSSSAFVWNDGSSFNYNSFTSGEPNDFSGNENCVQMGNPTVRQAAGSWSDSPCSNLINVVCKRAGKT
jgi:hypothetical protein